MEIDGQSLRDMRELLQDGVDEYWMTIDKNYILLNSLRLLVGLPIITEDHLKEMKRIFNENE